MLEVRARRRCYEKVVKFPQADLQLSLWEEVVEGDLQLSFQQPPPKPPSNATSFKTPSPNTTSFHEVAGTDLEKTHDGVNSLTPTAACLPSMQGTPIPNTRIGVTGKHHHMERHSTNGPLATTHCCCLTPKSPQGSSLHDGTPIPAQT